MQEQLTTSPLLSSLPKIRHGFLIDPPTAGRETFNKDIPEISTVKQVHGDLLLWIEKSEKREREADGIATFSPNLSVGVYSADCTPILAVALGEAGPLAVMAVHAGWRGTAKQIGLKALLTFIKRTRERGASEFAAAIGPCISFESFEVGEEVVAAFPGSLKDGRARFTHEEGTQKKFLFDLPGENARQLREAASRTSAPLRLDLLNECTVKKKDLYPSFRRDREKAGRILSYLCFET